MDGVFHRALDRVGSRCSLSNHFWMGGCFGIEKKKDVVFKEEGEVSVEVTNGVKLENIIV